MTLSAFLKCPSAQVKLAQVIAGVVVTVVTTSVQHVASLHRPVEQTMLPLFLEYPSGHEKLSQVGRGVVVTVVQGSTSTAQHVALSHTPAPQTSFAFILFHPWGQAKLSQVGCGVVVNVVGMKVQHVVVLHPPTAQTLLPAIWEYP